MGVDFKTCTICDETFPDCGDYFNCDCGQPYCSIECADGKYDENDTQTCRICRKEHVPDWKLLKFLLKEYSLTREAAEKLYFNKKLT